MPEDRLADITTFLTDGFGDPSPAQMWISDEPDRLQELLEGLAHAIVRDSAPPPFAGRQLLISAAATLLAALADTGDVGEFAARSIGELESSDATFGITEIDALLGSASGRVFLSALLDAVRDGRLGVFLALSDTSGLERCKAQAPRLLGLCPVTLVDTDPWQRFHASSLVVPLPADTDANERGWLVAVRCQLAAPAPALVALMHGSSNRDAGGAAVLDDERIQRVWMVEKEEGTDALMVSLAWDAASQDQIDLASEIAVYAARKAVWRSLLANESLTAVRQVFYA